MADLLIAATAELAGLVVLHLDKDFELITEVTGQSTETLVQAGLDMYGAHAIGEVPADTPPRR